VTARRFTRPSRSAAFGWLAVGWLAAYILIVVYNWRLPNKDGTSFGPIWAVGVGIVAVGLRHRRGRWDPVDALIACTAVGAVLTDLVQFNGQFLRDLGIYLRAGQHFLAGAPVYLTSVLTQAPIDKTLYPYLYPPPTLPFVAVLASLPTALVEAGWLAGSGAIAWAGLRLVGLGRLAALAALLWPPFFQGLYVGNIAVPAFGLFAAAPWFGAGLVLTAIFKPYSGLAALWLVGERRIGALAVGLAGVAGLAIVTLPLVGLDAWRAWIDGLGWYNASEAAIPALVSMGLAGWIPGVMALLLAVGAVGWAWLGRGREGLARFGVATVVASPSLFSHGFLVALPAFLALRPVALWLALGITSVAPGAAWWLAIVLVVGATRIPALRRATDDRWPGAYGTV
jgi:hypothetical protein